MDWFAPKVAAMLLLEQIRELVVGDEHVAVRGLRLAEAEQLGAQSAQLPSSCCGGEPQRLVPELLAVVVDPLQGVLGLLDDRGHRGHQPGASVLRRGLHCGAHDGKVLRVAHQQQDVVVRDDLDGPMLALVLEHHQHRRCLALLHRGARTMVPALQIGKLETAEGGGLADQLLLVRLGQHARRSRAVLPQALFIADDVQGRLLLRWWDRTALSPDLAVIPVPRTGLAGQSARVA